MQSRAVGWIWRGCLALALTAMAARCGWGQDLKSFEQRITTKVLPNGLTLLICERPDAPVFSYTTFIDAGDVDDPSGESGLAHMFEHLAFKGTSEIGTKDYADEKVALEKVEAANNAFEAEYLKPVGRDPQKLAALHKAFEEAQAEAEKYVIPNQFTEVAQSNGANGLNAETGLDNTQYFWSMPENRLELWAWLESGRLADGPARVLQGARRGDGRAAHAHGFKSHRPAGGAVPGDCVCGAQLWSQRHGLAQRAAARLPRPKRWTFTRSTTWARTSWWPWWAM